jgi:hypothetical protein
VQLGCPLRAISGREQPQQTIQYSITSSALASKLAGMFKPSVLAVFRLIINSYLVFLPWPTMAYSRLKLAIQDHSQRR